MEFFLPPSRSVHWQAAESLGSRAVQECPLGVLPTCFGDEWELGELLSSPGNLSGFKFFKKKHMFQVPLAFFDPVLLSACNPDARMPVPALALPALESCSDPLLHRGF